MSGLRSAVGFLTPVGGASAPEPRALDWFPVVGASLGAVLGVVWWEAGRLWPAVVAASLVLVADLGLTGLLHVDGLADSADGLLPHLDKPRRLAVMSEPGVGAFAVAVVGGTMLLRWAGLWGALGTQVSSLAGAVCLLAGIWCASRALMSFTTTAVPYARAEDGGLATAFIGDGKRARTSSALGLVASLVLLALWHLRFAPIVFAGMLLAWGGVIALARRRIGGYTGDVLGAAGVIAETVGLVLAAARW